MSFRNTFGSTLIELLVVISIIATIAVGLQVIFINSEQKGRDARRLADTEQFQSALRLYFVDSDNGVYPAVDSAHYNSASDGCGDGGRYCTLENVIKEYIAPMPRDPRGPQDNFTYMYDADSSDNYATYGFWIRFEHSSNISNLGETDGGRIDDHYEVGEQPVYCRDTYGDAVQANWWEGGSVNICAGGN